MESRVQDELKLHLTDNASTASRYVVGVFLSLLSALGTVGNATVLWVFWAAWSLQVYRVYLKCAADLPESTVRMSSAHL